MSDNQDGLKDKKFSRRQFVKLMGTGTMFLGLGAFGMSNLLKNIKQASGTTEAEPPNNNTNIERNAMGISGSMIVHVVRFTLKPNAPRIRLISRLNNCASRVERLRQSSYSVWGETSGESSIMAPCM